MIAIPNIARKSFQNFFIWPSKIAAIPLQKLWQLDCFSQLVDNYSWNITNIMISHTKMCSSLIHCVAFFGSYHSNIPSSAHRNDAAARFSCESKFFGEYTRIGGQDFAPQLSPKWILGSRSKAKQALSSSIRTNMQYLWQSIYLIWRLRKDR